MRTARVVTNLRCNQHCGYCVARRAEDDLAAIAPANVRRAIDDAVAAGAREIVLTGGEPTLRRDLAALVRHARAAGAEVTLETNATLLDAPRAAELAAAGLTRARVNLAGWGEALDGVTRDPGGFERTVAGLAALLAAGVPVAALAAVTRSTAPGLPALPGALAARFGAGAVRLLLAVPAEAPDPGELLSPAAAAEVVSAVAAAARGAGLAAQLAPDAGLPPCVFPARAPIASLYALSRGGAAGPRHARVAACTGCVVADRCPGFSAAALARFGDPGVTPLADDRWRRRLTVVGSIEEQIARELVQPAYVTDRGGALEEALVRINFHCNQACDFCFVSTHLPPPEDAMVRDAIVTAARAGKRLVLTGGEPTLHPRLVEYVRLAKAHTAHPVILQTNAVRVDEALAAALAGAGLDESFVSLHGASAEVSDAVTSAPGSFDKTLHGLDALAAAGIGVTVNFVVCGRNVHELVAWVELVAARWPRARLNLSFVAPATDLVPRTPDLVPRYADVLPKIAEAVAACERHGKRLQGFESMCGIPLCLVPTSLDAYFQMADVPPGFDGGEFLKPEACSRCALAGRCWGLRRGYAELHGDGELRPVRRPGGV